MIKQMGQLNKVQNTIQNASNKPTQFNAALPMRLEVMEKYQGVRYMVKIGNVAMETKSIKDLEVGGKYWAMMGKNNGSITLSNLIKQPSMLKDANIPLKLTPDAISQFLKETDNPFDVLKQFLGDKMASAESKWEFAFLSHMLMSLKHRVLTLPLNYEDESKNGFLQMRKKKIKEQDVLEFYSVFANLGATWGYLYKIDSNVRLDIFVMYESVARLLRNNLHELLFIEEINIGINPNILPLYDFSDGLLDLKG